MTWQEIYTKYKDTKLMKEFDKYTQQFSLLEVWIMTSNIKDIWGYLIVFAETKGWKFLLNEEVGTKRWGAEVEKYKECTPYLFEILDNIEQAMLWCADKFFEVSK